MTDQSVIVNPEALEPLFAPWKEPTLHRVRAKRARRALLERLHAETTVDLPANVDALLLQVSLAQEA